MRYKRTNYRFLQFSTLLGFCAILLMLFFEGFAYIDTFARSITDNPIAVGLIFFAIILFGSDLCALPFDYYKIFVIEEEFGFNKARISTFFTDKLKGWLMTGIIGGFLLGTIIWLYELSDAQFWWYAWGIITIFVFTTHMYYAKLIVPLFNKQTPLEHGELREKIEAYAAKVGFKLDNIFVIDGSKRSTKANAYFSGIGAEKRITLYDTLLNDLEAEEIIAVLAHEVGHYKKKHIPINLALSILITGFTLWVLSLLVGNLSLSLAFGIKETDFHIGLLAFGILYNPISEITDLLMNGLSREFEYQADNYAKGTFSADALITSLKKLSKNNLSNLTPHPAYVFMHYSHPTLLQRITKLNSTK